MKKWIKGSIYTYILKNFILIIVMAAIFYNAADIITDKLTGEILIMQYDEDIFEQEEWPKAAYELAIRISSICMVACLLLILVWIGFIILRMRKRIAEPLEQIGNAMEEYSGQKENVEHPFTASMQKSGILEIDNISDSFTRMTERLRQSEEQRKKLEAERQKMLADISHDLKTPITVIQGYAGAICDGLADETTQQKYVQTIFHKSEMLAELVNSFYEYSKLEHPQFTLEMKKDDICEYFREYLAIKYEELELAGFDLQAELPETKIPCEFDHAQLKRVFENIISNSVRHNGAGTTIFAHMQEREGTVLIRLGDDGKGVPAAIREHIFEPFVVGDEARTSGNGTGLGMAISKKIIEAHNGTIALLPENGYDRISASEHDSSNHDIKIGYEIRLNICSE